MIVNLSHLLLLKIVNYLDNIDKICFSLVSKSLFEERDKYLYFNTDHINILHQIEKEDEEVVTNRYYNGIFKLKSYQSLIQRSLNQKSNCTLTYGTLAYKTDYSIVIFGKDDIITPNITKVCLEEKKEDIFNLNHLKNLYRMITNSNVFSLKGISSLPSALPMNLTSIKFGPEFDEPFLAGYLPPNLKKLKFDLNSSFDYPISAGILPNTLEKLAMNDYFNQRLEPNVLPESLTFLELGSEFTQTLQVGSLPPNLRVLYHFGSSQISDGVLPKSLCTLVDAPFSWIPFIKTLNNLTTLSFNQTDIGNLTIDLSDLPVSLTNLDVGARCHLRSTLPPSIKHLKIHRAQYDIDEIFKDRSQYQLEELSVDALKQESLDNLKIKELILEFRQRKGFLRDIPLGVETLNFGPHFKGARIRKKENAEFPSSLKKFLFQFSATMNVLDFEIPNTVEEVEILHFLIGDSFTSGDKIPNSVKTLTVPFSVFEGLLMFNIPRSVTNICFTTKNGVDLIVRKLYDEKSILIFGQIDGILMAAIKSSPSITISCTIVYHSMIVTLSHLLLSKIVNFLDNIDRIVFTLVCKKWFDDRHRYLYFNTDHINIINQIEKEDKEEAFNDFNSLLTLKSYQSLILRSLKQKNNCTLTFGAPTYKTDYSKSSRKLLLIAFYIDYTILIFY
ncbi:hypothetical protein PPL_06559 [Heterostelium album PN500]|uniref:F-box domain-containing protein n=1 Tax=Heterostelium pallidum (strain ATCC 26659 / Pp 5 / PN500) TaxID=670386 RepID=D3BDH6_HETP5|nr:hypothetical protein PPL_06559 [Heterostelium album PN500]EFA80620.1 hypothetical protein PPL_06559 [Heterostelium album PN500]|eukprot:XP_020432740.1 hypothetical protein PPL_06559 [Heterostelium album PN500]